MATRCLVLVALITRLVLINGAERRILKHRTERGSAPANIADNTGYFGQRNLQPASIDDQETAVVFVRRRTKEGKPLTTKTWVLWGQKNDFSVAERQQQEQTVSKQTFDRTPNGKLPNLAEDLVETRPLPHGDDVLLPNKTPKLPISSGREPETTGDGTVSRGRSLASSWESITGAGLHSSGELTQLSRDLINDAKETVGDMTTQNRQETPVSQTEVGGPEDLLPHLPLRPEDEKPLSWLKIHQSLSVTNYHTAHTELENVTGSRLPSRLNDRKEDSLMETRIKSTKEHELSKGHRRYKRQATDEELLPDSTNSTKQPSVTKKNDTEVDPDQETDSSLTYRSKGRMGYVDRPKSKSAGNGKALILGDMEPVQPEPEPTTINVSTSTPATTTPSAASPSTTELMEHVILLGIEDGALDIESRIPNMNDSHAEPEGEPEGESEPEPEHEPTNSTGIKDDDQGGFVDCKDDLCYAEPHPDWDIAKPMYGGAWEFHIYSFGIAFAILAIYSFVSMIVLRRKANLLSKGYFMSLNFMLLLMGTTRAVYLMVDGYDSHGRFHPIVSYMLINISFPCLTSAFSILFLAMLRAIKMQIISKKIQKVSVLLIIILVHFLLSFSVDVVVGLVYNLRVLFLVCQITFVIWGALLFSGYFYLFWKLYNSPSMDRESTYQYNQSFSGVAPTFTSPNTTKTKRFTKLRTFHQKVMLNLALKVTLSTACFGMLYIGIVIYGMVDVFNVFAKESPMPWPFWGYHFGVRLLELAMCATMSFVATQPMRYQDSNKRLSKDSDASLKSRCTHWLYFIPCYRCCSVVEVERASSSAGARCVSSEDGAVSRHVDSTGPGVRTAWCELGQDLPPPSPGETCEDMAPDCRKRPSSMLYYDGGLVRFRQEGDSEGDPLASTDDELDLGEPGPPRYQQVAQANDVVANGGHDRSYLTPYLTRERHWRRGLTASPGPSGFTTPGTPLSLCSTDLDVMSGDISFRPPSSIHLRASIDRALNYSDLQLRTPDPLATVDSISLPESPDALRASMYSYATAYQDSVAASLSPARKLYSAQSFRASTPSLNYHQDPEISASGWFQRYFWERFGQQHRRRHTESTDNSTDDNLSDTCVSKQHYPYGKNSPANRPRYAQNRFH